MRNWYPKFVLAVGLALACCTAIMVIACGGLASWCYVSSHSYKSLIVGKWEFQNEEGTWTMTFVKDGTLTSTTDDGLVGHGKWKYIGKNRIKMDLTFLFTQEITYKIQFPDKNTMITTNERTGKVTKWRRFR